MATIANDERRAKLEKGFRDGGMTQEEAAQASAWLGEDPETGEERKIATTIRLSREDRAEQLRGLLAHLPEAEREAFIARWLAGSSDAVEITELKTPSQIRDEVAAAEQKRVATPEARIERTLRYASTLAGAGLSRADAIEVAQGAYPLPGRSDLGVTGLDATKRQLARWRGHVVRTLLGSGWEEADAEKLASKLFPATDHL